MTRTLSSALLALVAMLLYAEAVAQPMPEPVIAVIDVERLMRESEASQSIYSQLEQKRASYQDEISNRESVLRTADQELAKQRAVLSPEAFADRQVEFQKQVAETQRQVQSRKRQLDKGFAEAMRSVEKAIAEVSAEIASSKGANVVLAKTMVVYSDASIDITDEVLERLDEMLPTVAVLIEE